MCPKMGHMGHITQNGAQMGHKLISKKNKAIVLKTSRIFLERLNVPHFEAHEAHIRK